MREVREEVLLRAQQVMPEETSGGSRVSSTACSWHALHHQDGQLAVFEELELHLRSSADSPRCSVPVDRGYAGALTVARRIRRHEPRTQGDAILKEMIVITTRTTLGKNERKNLETCITVHVHQRDTSEDLQKKRIKDPADFEWMKQCRFYWNKERETVIISICDVDFEYRRVPRRRSAW